MINKIKFKEINFSLLYFLIALLAVVNITDSYSFLSKITKESVSFQDVVIYVISGINKNGRTGLIDVLRFSTPFLIILFVSGIYFTDILDGSKKYLYLIRYKYYKIWIRKNVFKMIISAIIAFTIYYFFTVIASLVFIENRNGFTEIFYRLHPFYDNQSEFIKVFFYQYLLSITFSILIVIFQILLSMSIKNTHKSFIVMSFIIIFLSFLGIYDIYNPLMLCKQKILNTSIEIHPLITIIINSTLSVLVYLFTVKMIRLSVGRDGI